MRTNLGLKIDCFQKLLWLPMFECLSKIDLTTKCVHFKKSNHFSSHGLFMTDVIRLKNGNVSLIS